ncbi:MAG: DUF452 family protein [Opitutales bacterium]
MREVWLKKNAFKKLVIFFSGFASDESLLQDFKVQADSDLLMFCDYENLDFPKLPEYESVSVVAWSFGVWVANYFRDKIENASGFTCINGSPFAVDDERGILNTVFDATVENFTESAKEKFFLRTCLNRKYYQEHSQYLSSLGAERLKSQLEFLGKAFRANNYYVGKWDKVIISKQDKIFPLQNLLKVFPNAEIVEGAHFNLELIESVLKSVLSRSLEIKDSFEGRMQSYEKNAKVQEYIADNLALCAKDIEAENILELGAGTGFLTKNLAKNFPNSKFFINDLSEVFCKKALEISKLNAKIYSGDLMIVDFQESYDAIFSASCFQWVENQKELYKKLHSLLNTKGYLCFSTFSKNNFKEVSKLTNKSLNYLNQSELVGILEALGFEILEARTESIVKTFKEPIDVLRHIKATGVNATFKTKWARADLKNFCESYEEKDGLYPLTYEAIYIKARKI